MPEYLLSMGIPWWFLSIRVSGKDAPIKQDDPCFESMLADESFWKNLFNRSGGNYSINTRMHLFLCFVRREK